MLKHGAAAVRRGARGQDLESYRQQNGNVVRRVRQPPETSSTVFVTCRSLHRRENFDNTCEETKHLHSHHATSQKVKCNWGEEFVYIFTTCQVDVGTTHMNDNVWANIVPTRAQTRRSWSKRKMSFAEFVILWFLHPLSSSSSKFVTLRVCRQPLKLPSAEN